MSMDLEKLASELRTNIYEFAEDTMKLRPEAFELLMESVADGPCWSQLDAKATAAGASPELLELWRYFKELPICGADAIIELSMAWKYLKQAESILPNGLNSGLVRILMSCAMHLSAADVYGVLAFYSKDWIGGRFVADDDPEAMKAAASRLATSGADARHSFNRSRKTTGKGFYMANKDRFNSVKKMAEALAKLLSVEPETAKVWIAEWRREEGEASKG